MNLGSTNLKNINACLSFMSLILLAFVLRVTSSIMIPFVLSIFFTIIITPIVSYIEKLIWLHAPPGIHNFLLSSLDFECFYLIRDTRFDNEPNDKL